MVLASGAARSRAAGQRMFKVAGVGDQLIPLARAIQAAVRQASASAL